MPNVLLKPDDIASHKAVVSEGLDIRPKLVVHASGYGSHVMRTTGDLPGGIRIDGALDLAPVISRREHSNGTVIHLKVPLRLSFAILLELMGRDGHLLKFIFYLFISFLSAGEAPLTFVSESLQLQGPFSLVKLAYRISAL